MKRFISFVSVVLLVNAQTPPSTVIYQNINLNYERQWNKELVFWAADCITDITVKISTTDRLHWVIKDDIRYHLGTLMGRLFELHRQQVDMYRRIKNHMEGKFHWFKDEMKTSVTSPDGKTVEDYKPYVYITALEYITKRELDIEHIVKLVTDYTGEDELAKFDSYMLPGSVHPYYVWQSYTTPRGRDLPDSKKNVGRQGVGLPDSMEQKENALKQAMHERYYDQRKNKNDKR